MFPPIFTSLKFWESIAWLVAALLAMFQPDWGITAGAILAVILAVLKMLGITPELRARFARGYEIPPIFKVRKFWEALAFIIAAVVVMLKPEWIITEAMVLAVFLSILSLFGIVPELRARVQ